MKKLFALFVMAIFLISLVPAAFAVNDNAGQGQGGVNDQISDRQVKAVQAKEKIKSIRERYQESVEKFKQNREQFRERMDTAKERRAEAKAKHQEARQKIEERKEALKACKASETENCKQLRKETKIHTKEYLSNVAEHILAMIAKTKERIEASDMPEEQKTALLSKLDAKAEEIAGAAESIAELGEESTKEDFVEAAKIIKESWKDTKDEIKKGAGKVAANKIRAVTNRLDQLSTKVHKMLERLKNAGEDTSKAQEQLDAYDQNLASAKAARDEAESLYQSGDIDGAVAKTKEAHRYLLEAHKALKQLVQDIKSVKGGENALKEKEQESEQEQEEEGDEDTPAEQDEEDGEETSAEENEGNQTGSEGNETA